VPRQIGAAGHRFTRERTLVSRTLIDFTSGVKKLIAEMIRYPGGYLRFAWSDHGRGPPRNHRIPVKTRQLTCAYRESGKEVRAMKKTYAILGVLVLALLVVSLLPGVATAWPRNDGQPMTRWAVAGGWQSLGDGTMSAVEVWANDAAPASPYKQLFVQWIKVKWVGDEGELLAAASGEATLAAPALKCSGLSLTKARLRARVHLTDDLSGDPWGDVQLDLVWTGTGPIEVSSYHGLVVDEETGQVYRLNTTGRGRDATVVGTIGLPDGSAITGGDLTGFLFGSISVSRLSR
jgi:hypothetical protein